MKSPDDIAARKARLVREHCEAFMAGDDEGYAATAAELRALLEAEGVAQAPKGGGKPGLPWSPPSRRQR